MTFQHNSTAFHSRSNDAPFELQDILFTRTNAKGVLTEANARFQALTGLSESDISGAPHSIVRHPDMPKCVFELMWKQLKQGSTTGSYLLNRTQDGHNYWVYAVIAPMPEGYVSTQVKPNGEMLEQIRDIYRDLLALEKAGSSLEDSCSEFEKRLAVLGYTSFEAFVAAATVSESSARDDALKRADDTQIHALEQMLTPLNKMVESQKSLMNSFAAIRGIPSNMRIVASRLEPAGGPISAISQNYRLMSDEVTSQLTSFYVTGETKSLPSAVLENVERIMLYSGACKFFEELDPKSTAADQGEVNDLEELIQNYTSASRSAILDVCKYIERLARSSKDVRQLVTGLDSIRVLCRVEAGRLGADSVSLIPVIDQLDKFHKEIDTTLEQISDYAEQVGAMADTARKRY